MTLATSTIENLENSGTANVANRLLQRGLRNVVMNGIVPLAPNQPKLIGEAFTLRFIPAREDLDSMKNYGLETNMHRRAIEECPPGKVLVIDAFDQTNASAMGDMMARRLVHRGVVGSVTNGGFRDAEGISESGLTAYHRHSAIPATPIRLHPVALNEPVGVGGVAVYPNDVLFGDSDGIVVIPAHLADEVAAESADDASYENFAAQEIHRGASLYEVFPATEESYQRYLKHKTDKENYRWTI